MTSGRKPAAPAQLQGPDFVTATPTEIVAQEHQAREVLRGEDLVMQFEEPLRQLGQIDSFEFMRRVADVGLAQVFENLRNSGKYKGLPYKDSDGNLRHVADITEFCEAKLGKSYRRCMELSQNLRALGPELYEQSERLGLRNVDYKALRALPDDEQLVIKQAIEQATTKEEVVNLLEDMALRHHREREALAEREAGVAQAQADISARIAAKDKLIAEKSKRISELVEEKNRHEGLTDSEREEGLEARLAEATLDAVTHLFPIRAAVDAIRGLERTPQGLYVAMQSALHRVITEAESIATDYGISLDFGIPTLSTDDALANLDDPNADEDFGPDYKPL